jgi:hypothetical protein
MKIMRRIPSEEEMYCHFDKILSESKHFENNNKIKR